MRQPEIRTFPRFLALLGLLLPTLGVPLPGAGDPVVVSPDVTVDLSGVIVADEDAARDTSGTVTLESLGALPASAEVIAVDVVGGASTLFALDTHANLGGTVYRPGDVIDWNGVGYSLFFDAAAAGVPDGVRVDAVSSAVGSSDFLLSFDVTVDLGGGLVVQDEDVVRYSGGVPSLEFDGSSVGLADGLDVDGVSDLGSGQLALSFDTSGSIGGVSFDDEDIVSYDAGGAVWTLVYDADAAHPSLAAADVQAITLPEPGAWIALVAGGSFLGALARRRRDATGRRRH